MEKECTCLMAACKRLASKEEYTPTGILVEIVTYECGECGVIYDDVRKI